MKQQLNALLNRFSLRTVLLVAFVTQALIALSVVGYLSFKNGQVAVTELSGQLRREVTDRILQQLLRMIEDPYIINQINANSLLNGELDLVTGRGETQLWQQARVYQQTNLIYCATEKDGAYLGVGRAYGGTGLGRQIQMSNPDTNRLIRYYDADKFGQRATLRRQGDRPYDPRVRPWYITAKQAKREMWSDIYLDFEVRLPTITAATPVIDARNNLIGVCATDLILSEEINQFLQTLKIGKTGIAFILDRDQSLVATSTQNPTTQGSGENSRLIRGQESDNALIREATSYLVDQQYDLDYIDNLQGEFKFRDETQYLEATRFKDNYGINWMIVLVMPEKDFMSAIHHNAWITFWLCLLTLAISVAVSSMITKWLIWPVVHLNNIAKKLSRGEWNQSIEIPRSDALGDLSRSFATMARQLQEAFSSLEQRVEERTAELVHLNRELQRISRIDSLTQVANRRYFDLYLDQEWEKACLSHQVMTLILCDVDYFKKYNDTYGHPAGDHCLQVVAQLLRETVQYPQSLVARYGGEEFAIILPGVFQDEAIALAELLGQSLAELELAHATSDKGIVSFSLGIATQVPTWGTSLEVLLHRADEALYRAKQQGRDRYCVDAEDETNATQTVSPSSSPDAPEHPTQAPLEMTSQED
jgi:diguanylate cyclase (GGDEF)-like protein